MIYLRQSTASQEVPLGYFLDSTDGDTEETALTIANTDIKVWKAGATTLANKTSGGATHISNGVYYAVLDATDTNTLGALVIFVHVSGALAVRVECMVLPAWRYDLEVAGLGALDTGTAQAGAAGTITLRSGASASDDVYNENIIYIQSGTGSGQTRYIVDYVGTTKVASVDPNWATNPSTDSVYVVLPAPATPQSEANTPKVQIVGTKNTLDDLADFDPTASNVTVGTNDDKTNYSLSAAGVGAILDEVVEGAMTLRQAVRIVLAATSGKASGLATTTAIYRDLADAKARITATVDADGNRTAVTLDAT